MEINLNDLFKEIKKENAIERNLNSKVLLIDGL
jgi:hypothetical protein